MQNLPFDHLFCNFIPGEDLSGKLDTLVIEHAELSREVRCLTLWLFSETYLTQKDEQALQAALTAQYGLRRAELHLHFPEALLPQMDFRDLAQVFIRAYSPAAGSLAGATYELTGGKLSIHLPANGKAELEPHIPKAQNFLKSRFGVAPEIEITAHSALEGRALFDETARIRREAMAQAPAVQIKEAAKKASSSASSAQAPTGDMIFGRPFGGEVVKMKDLNLDMYRVVVAGKVFAVNHKELKKRNAWVVSFDVTDYTSSVRINQFMENDKAKPILTGISPGMWVKIQGKMTFDRYDNEMVMQPNAIVKIAAPVRTDTAPEKRVELHLHTNMSSMDALTSVFPKAGPDRNVIKRAESWGHKAIAITDHGGAQSFPNAMHSAKNIKILYGCEGYYVNDVDDRIAVHGSLDASFDDEYVAFDLETTGLSSQHDTIIEIGAAIMKRDQVIDTFQTFVAPGRRLLPKIIELTGITDQMLEGAPSIEEVLPKFLDFVGGRPLCAHNADFDIGFITAACERLELPFQPTYVDTLILAQNLMPDLGKYKLNIVADALSLPEFNHHRASDDAITCGYLMMRFWKMLDEQGIHTLSAVNPRMAELRAGGRIFRPACQTHHCSGEKLHRSSQPLPAHLLRQPQVFQARAHHAEVRAFTLARGLDHRLGVRGRRAVFQAVVNHKSWAELKRIAEFYDYLEIQPICNNRFMLEKGMAEDEEELRSFNRTIVKLGDELGKPVVATGDVHFLDPEDEIYRHILLATKQMPDADKPLPIYFKTTDEMLEEFSYLGAEKAYEVVVKNTNMIADWCETVRPVPHNLFAPKIENSVEDLKALVYGKLHRLYGENPPELIQKRVDTEMHDIISCHYDVIYMSAQKLVQNSLEHGYLVGSRGSVGSSIVAFMSGITEVNSFPPHYRCPKCQFTTFEVPDDCACGADLPDAVCPKCGAQLDKDGFNIPFETFLGFGGTTRSPSPISTSTSGEYQARAHAYCVEMFGSDHVFRAGTIGTVAEKTAYGYVKKYLSERDMTVSKAEENRLASGCVDVKRTTGQHPGGLAGVDAQKIPLDDKDTMSIFTSSKILGFENDPILGPVGSCAIPEFGTGFTRGMLQETQPTKFDTLIRLSGFSHGTDVWLGNARDLILSKTASVNDAIGCRDDIMLYLIKCGMPEKRSFKIMEAVRKGRGLPEGAEDEMKAAGVPEWYIGSCKKIKYLFPKAHATAYVMMAFRIAWFKVHEPLAFYAAYFYRRSQKGGFDAAMMTHGIELVKQKLQEIDEAEDATAKDDDLFTTLEVCYEFYLRGFTFAPIDLYRSHATRFVIEDGKLLPPFVSVSGLGETAAWDIMDGREGKTFLSIEEFSLACPKVSKTHIENLKAAGAFGDLPETSQITLF